MANSQDEKNDDIRRRAVQILSEALDYAETKAISGNVQVEVHVSNGAFQRAVRQLRTHHGGSEA